MEDMKEEETTKRKKKRSTHSHRTTEHDLRIRRRVGSMVKMEEYGKMIADDDEVDVLENRDIDDMAAHRMDRMGAVARHTISRRLSRPDDLVRVRRKKRHKQDTDMRDAGETTDAEHHFVSKMYGYDPSDTKQFDKTPHEIFVQMSELDEEHTLWVERSRWIKYEECKEEGAERWGRPHLSSLSFHSLINLRLCLEKAIIVLDYDQAKDFTNIVYKLVEECSSEGYIMDEHIKAELLRLLLIRHKFVDVTGEWGTSEGKLRGIKRSLSKASMAVRKKTRETCSKVA